jgi:hypothetical protein
MRIMGRNLIGNPQANQPAAATFQGAGIRVCAIPHFVGGSQDSFARFSGNLRITGEGERDQLARDAKFPRYLCLCHHNVSITVAKRTVVSQGNNSESATWRSHSSAGFSAIVKTTIWKILNRCFIRTPKRPRHGGAALLRWRLKSHAPIPAMNQTAVLLAPPMRIRLARSVLGTSQTRRNNFRRYIQKRMSHIVSRIRNPRTSGLYAWPKSRKTLFPKWVTRLPAMNASKR